MWLKIAGCVFIVLLCSLLIYVGIINKQLEDEDEHPQE